MLFMCTVLMVLEVVLVVLEVVLQLLLLQLLLLQLRVLLKLPSPPAGGGNFIFRLPYHTDSTTATLSHWGF